MESATASQTSKPERIYHAPRLDKAFEFQAYNLTYGKKALIALPILLLGLWMYDDGVGIIFTILGVVGTGSFWFSYMKVQGHLEQIERDLYRDNQDDGIHHDISALKCLMLQFGPLIAFFTSIFAVIALFLSMAANNSNDS